jgi:hypothetical protein
MCIKTEKLKFLDITIYLAPGFSYSQYLKAYKCTEQKGFFSYEWMTPLDKLNVGQLPPHEAFSSNRVKKSTFKAFTSYFPVCCKHDPTVSLVSPSETKQMGMVLTRNRSR